MKMTEQNSYERITHNWRAGLSNLLDFEIAHWWKTRRWWLQSLIWIIVVNGSIAAMALVVLPLTLPPTEQSTLNPSQLIPLYVEGIGFFGPLGIILLMHGVVVSERQSGVTAWILSKPVSRSTYVMSKFVGNALGILFSVVFLPGVIAYVMLSLGFVGSWLSFGFLAALALIALEALFYIAFTIMLGTLFRQPIPVLAVGIGFFLSQQILIMAFPFLFDFLPISLSKALFMPVALYQQLPTIIPIVANLVWISLWISIAVWRFSKEEF